MQRIAEPLAGAKKLENGTRFVEIIDKDLSFELEQASSRENFEKVKDLGEAFEATEEDGEAIRTALLDSIPEDELERWNAILDRELGKFKPGEEYDYATDMRRSFAKGLSTPEAYKILKTIPDHVFWDIKKPLNMEEKEPHNKYNMARNYPNHDFFDTRQQEQWLRDRRE